MGTLEGFNDEVDGAGKGLDDNFDLPARIALASASVTQRPVVIGTFFCLRAAVFRASSFDFTNSRKASLILAYISSRKGPLMSSRMTTPALVGD